MILLCKQDALVPLSLDFISAFFLLPQLKILMLCDYFSSFITSKDVAKSTVKIAVKVLTNSMASTMSFKGQNTKKPFYKLKIWEAIQGSILIKFDDTVLFKAEETMKTWLANAPRRKQDNETYGKKCMKRKLEVNTAK
nr:PREDICTED: uncharacterized protein LOC105671865 [Linepithema humile]XP_012221790.1 PREDICTED: uncharacterized protein LOC105671865 [Linepithema humile]